VEYKRQAASRRQLQSKRRRYEAWTDRSLSRGHIESLHAATQISTLHVTPLQPHIDFPGFIFLHAWHILCTSKCLQHEKATNSGLYIKPHPLHVGTMWCSRREKKPNNLIQHMNSSIF
jgi:hypothetical protein